MASSSNGGKLTFNQCNEGSTPSGATTYPDVAEMD